MVEALRTQSAEFIDDLKEAAVEALQSDELLATAAVGFREDLEDLAELNMETATSETGGAGDAALKRLQRRVARGPRR